MATVQLAGNNVGGVVQGVNGVYQMAADGTFTVDTKDAPACLALGMTYIKTRSTSYYTGGSVLAASAAASIASTTLSNGALTILAQPDVSRQIAVIMGTSTTAITAGSVAITYLANDGSTQTDNLTAVLAASAVSTQFLSKGVSHINTAVVSGLVGGLTPYIFAGLTATIALPVDLGTVDLVVTKENVTGADETVGTLSTVSLGCIAPTSAPNATRTYSFLYAYTAPTA